VRVGILYADDLGEDVISEYGDYADMFQNLLQCVDKTLSFSTYHVTRAEYPSTIDVCDAYLLTGSKFGAYEDEDWIRQLTKFIIELHRQEKKLTGICFGHQLIAHALGGLAQKSEKGWGMGVMSSDVNQAADKCAWLTPGKDSFSLLVSHQDQVVKLPPGAELVASNVFCPIAAFRIGESVLTFQGHPEFSVEYLRYIMDNRREQLGEEKYSRALSSLRQPIDSELVAQWLVNFITG